MIKSKVRQQPAAPADSVAHPISFPIIGIGASAGGLEAFTQFLASLPAQTGMAFVLIQHLDPTHSSLLGEVLARKTEMPVQEIRNGTILEPDHVYVIAPDTDAAVLRGAFTVLPRQHAGKPHLPVDFFFRSLAAEQRSQAIGLVLSGTARDGTEGLRAIKSEGGVTLAQDPKTAKFNGMPQSAVSAGVVDLVLPIAELAREIVRLARHPYVAGEPKEPLAQSEDEDLRKVFALLRNAVGVDLSEYKETTVRRRLDRRMALRKTETVQAYATLLEETGGEAQALLEDILIHVTSFFRDPDVFEALQQRVFPEILKDKQSGEPIRMWVPGCSTGEEAYSLAISIFEFLGDSRPKRPVQIFGTDLSEAAIAKVRAGLYPESAVSHLSPERLERFFTHVEGGSRVTKEIRDACVFVRHDLARDPPFSKLDLISCRNVLIYFNQSLQQRLLGTFHYCLNIPGFLLLGSAESMSSREELFSAVDKPNKIFARTAGIGGHWQRRTGNVRSAPRQDAAARTSTEPVSPTLDLGRQVDHLLLAQYAPAGVVVNERLEILQFHGRTAPYLEPPPGKPDANLLRMARVGLVSELRIALARAKKQMTTVRKDGVRVEEDGSTTTCNIVVVPLSRPQETKERLFAVLFEDARLAPPLETPLETKKGARAAGKRRRTEPGSSAKVEHELRATKEYLQSLIEEHQQTNDALASTNEELVSANEELQSLNEEMETGKEELQSTNEELTTLNDELQHRNRELSQLNSDINNLLHGVEIPIVIVDASLRIRRFTPKAGTTMNLLSTDVGRPINDIRLNLSVEHLDQQITAVMEAVAIRELEVQDHDGRWFRMQIRPYKTVDNKIDGALISLVDIDVLKRTVTDAEYARDYAAAIVEAVQVPLVALDEKLAVRSANAAFYKNFVVSREETEGRSLFELGGGQWDIAELQTSLREMLTRNTHFQHLKVQREFPLLGNRTMSLSARRVRSSAGAPTILLAIEDITERERGERERARLLRHAQSAEAEAEKANQAKDRFLAVLSHELRTPLSALLLQLDMLRRKARDGSAIDRPIDAIERAARIQARLTDDLLDISRIVAGKLDLQLREVSILAIVREALDMANPLAAEKSVALESALDESTGPVMGDAARLRQVVWNLLINAIKFTPNGGRVAIRMDHVNGLARVEVRDTGIGMEPDILPKIFDPFSQAEQGHGGLGLGLAIVRHVVELHHGTVYAESSGLQQGAIFTVTLPTVAPSAERRTTGDPEQARPLEEIADTEQRAELDGVRILVVEDESLTREPLVEMLGDLGALVKGAASAAEAMEIFEQFRPQLLVCDIGMRHEDGHGLIRRIRELGPERGGEVPALALTALASEQDRQQALAAGFHMHLAKPVGFDDVREAVLTLYRMPPSERREKPASPHRGSRK